MSEAELVQGDGGAAVRPDLGESDFGDGGCDEEEEDTDEGSKGSHCCKQTNDSTLSLSLSLALRSQF